MSGPFEPRTESDWKEYIVCARCGLLMGGPPEYDRSCDWQDWAGSDVDAICSGCGARGTDSLFHFSDLMEAIRKAGLPNPETDPGFPPWREAGFFLKWTIPEEVRNVLLDR